MPHYADGTLAVVGDIVRGKGYNVKDENGELAEIVGVLISVTPDTAACNVKVLLPSDTLGTLSPIDPTQRLGYLVTGLVEYGQADHFEKVT